MQPKPIKLSAFKNYLVFGLIGLIWLTIFANIFPLSALVSQEWSDNPARCGYYISLQSILANTALLSSDKANSRFIKSRLATFENDIVHPGSMPAVALGYKNAYYQALSQFGLKTINAAVDDGLVMAIAGKTNKIVDNYYLDDRIHCISPLYTWNTAHTIKRNPHRNARRILQYNLASLYDSIPSRYLRILGAAQDEFQLGVFSGFFVNNQTTSLNIQLMTGVPMLTALYVLPRDDFAHMGTYLATVPWNSFYGIYFTRPSLRKILNIAGIDVFTVETSDPDWQKIPDAVPVPASLNKAFVIANELHTYINTESYGMAYLANHITYENPKAIKKYEKSIKNNFASGGQHQDSFLGALNQLYSMLGGLKDKYDIILEAKQADQIPAAEMTDMAGSTDIKGIVGERASFTTDCLRQDCTLVFNTAKAPGWHAYVNGKAVRLERANFAFMAIPVPNGHAVVWFIYQSWACLLSYLISMLSLIYILFRTVRFSNPSSNPLFTTTGF